MAIVVIRVIGSIRIERSGQTIAVPEARLRATLSLLAASAPRVVSDEEIVAELWGDDPPRSVRTALQTYVSRLRALLGRDATITRSGGGYCLLGGSVAVDLHEMSERLRAALELRRSDPIGCLSDLRSLDLDAMELPFADVPRGPGLSMVRENFAGQLVDSLLLLAELERDGGDVARSESAARAVVGLDPRNPAAWVALVRALLAAQRMEDAKATVLRARTQLGEEVGLDPPRVIDQLAREVEELELPGHRSRVPSALRVPQRLPFVGRTGELSALRFAWDRVHQGDMAVVLVTGDAGVGKTALVAHAVTRLTTQATVLYGAGAELVGGPLGPMAAAIASWWRDEDHEAIEQLPASVRSALEFLAPDQVGADVLVRYDRPEMEGERYRLMAAISRLFDHLTSSRPLVLVLDDMQWSDPTTWLLLRHLSRSGGLLGVLVVVICRTPDARSPTAEHLVELRRHPLVTWLELGGLPRRDIEVLIGPDLVPFLETIERDTGGNPFHLNELMREAGDIGSLADRSAIIDLVPAGVEVIVNRRLSRLPRGSLEALQCAAVVGHEFDLRMVLALAPEPSAALADLEVAEEHGFIVPFDPTDRYAFRHDHLRRVVLRTMTSLRQRELHQRVAERLMAEPGGGWRAATTAGHVLAAQPLMSPTLALEWCRRAGEEALRTYAFESAAEWFRQALGHLPIDDPMRPSIDVRLQLGEALRRAGDPEHSAILRSVVHDAAAIGDLERRTQAVLSLAEFSSASDIGQDQSEARDLIEQCTDELARSPLDELRACAGAALAELLATTSDADRRAPLFRTSLALVDNLPAADPSKERALLYVCRRAYFALDDPYRLDERTDVSRRFLDLGQRTQHAENRFEALRLHVSCALQAADLEGARAGHRRMDELARVLGQPFFDWVVSVQAVSFELLVGNFDRAEELALRGRDLGGRAGLAERRLDATLAGQLIGINDARGRPDEMRKPAEGIGRHLTSYPAALSFGLLANLITGDRGAIRRSVDAIVSDGVVRIPQDFTYTLGMWILAQAASVLDDAALASVVAGKLDPLSTQWTWTGGLLFGPVAAALGLARAVLGDPNTGVTFDRAEALCQAMEAPVWLERIRSLRTT